VDPDFIFVLKLAATSFGSKLFSQQAELQCACRVEEGKQVLNDATAPRAHFATFNTCFKAGIGVVEV